MIIEFDVALATKLSKSNIRFSVSVSKLKWTMVEIGKTLLLFLPVSAPYKLLMSYQLRT